MLRQAETGDIVLFSGKDVGSTLIRSLTRSKFDHVGLLVKLSDHLILFESLAGKGVCKWRWDSLQSTNYWQTHCTKVVYRKLLGVKRSNDFLNKVRDFVTVNLGK